jgi:hypothetical protein
MSLLQSPETPPIESILTALINEIAALPGAGAIELRPPVLVLDDYYVIESRAIDEALTFLLDHLPPNPHPVDLSHLPASGVSGRKGPAQDHPCDRQGAYGSSQESERRCPAPALGNGI